jgi:hypothetical protein
MSLLAVGSCGDSGRLLRVTASTAAPCVSIKTTGTAVLWSTSSYVLKFSSVHINNGSVQKKCKLHAQLQRAAIPQQPWRPGGQDTNYGHIICRERRRYNVIIRSVGSTLASQTQSSSSLFALAPQATSSRRRFSVVFNIHTYLQSDPSYRAFIIQHPRTLGSQPPKTSRPWRRASAAAAPSPPAQPSPPAALPTRSCPPPPCSPPRCTRRPKRSGRA